MLYNDLAKFVESLPGDVTSLGNASRLDLSSTEPAPAVVNLGEANLAQFIAKPKAPPTFDRVTFDDINSPSARDLATLAREDVGSSFELVDGRIRPKYVPIRDKIKPPIGRADYGWDADMRRRHLTSAYARGWQQFPYQFSGHNGVLHIVGGGPSLRGDIKALRRWSQKPKNFVLAVNKTHDFLWNLPKEKLVPPIKVWGAALLDPCDWVKDYITPRSGVQYFIGDQCAPTTFDVFDKLELSKWIWRATNPDKDHDIVPQKMAFIYGGSTVGLRMRTMAYYMGFREIHYWGFDSSCEVSEANRSGKLHAYEKIDSVNDRVTVKIIDEKGFEKEFMTNTHMGRQAQEYIEIRDHWIRLFREGKVEWLKDVFHGDGLLPTIAARMALHADPKRNYAEDMQSLVCDVAKPPMYSALAGEVHGTP